MWNKKQQAPASPLSGVTESTKELFEILEMRSLTPDYFDRFEPPGTAAGSGRDGSWVIGLLHDNDGLLNAVTTTTVSLTPVVMLVSEEGLVVFDESSARIVLACDWARMCRIDLKPVEEGDYQVFALSHLVTTLSVAERFPDERSMPLEASEIGVHYLYTHANPSTFGVIDRYWSRTHIPQHLHRLPSLLR